MASITHTTVRRGRHHLAITAGVVLAALTASAATMALPGPAEAKTSGLTLLGGGVPAAAAGPRTPIPGYLLERGRYARFDAPNAVQQTVPFGINNRGVIVGKYTDAAGVDHGFRRDPRERFVTLDFPGAAATQLDKINNRGQVVGEYR